MVMGINPGYEIVGNGITKTGFVRIEEIILLEGHDHDERLDIVCRQPSGRQ